MQPLKIMFIKRYNSVEKTYVITLSEQCVTAKLYEWCDL